VVHACNPCTQEAESGRLRARGLPGLQSDTRNKDKSVQTRFAVYHYILKMGLSLRVCQFKTLVTKLQCICVGGDKAAFNHTLLPRKEPEDTVASFR
jgi:hypothetical protein